MPSDAPSVDEFLHYLKRGHSFLQGNNLVEAKENLERALEIKPGDDRTLNLLAMVFFKLEQYPKAIRIFKQLVKTNPNFPTLYMNLGLAYLKQGDYDAAEQEFQRVIQMDPGHVNAHNYLGLVYSHVNRFEEARDEFQKANSPNMVAKMEEKIRMASPEAGYNEPAPQEASFEEIKFEQPPEAYSTFGEAESSEYAPAPSESLEYAAEGGYPTNQSNVALAPPEGVVEEPPPPPPEIPASKEIVVHKPTVWSLKELTKFLAISKDNVPDIHLRNEKLMQIVLKGGQVYARLGGMVASEGELSFSTAFKRFKGKETKAIFGGKDDPIMRISGEGQLLLSSQDHRLGLFNLEDEMIYLSENSVFAFQDGILWENGRIQTEGAEDLNLAQFKGRGTVGISTKGKLVSISVGARSPLTIDFNSLIGWFGKIVPQVKFVEPPSGGGKGKRTVVELKGDGDVLLEETFST